MSTLANGTTIGRCDERSFYRLKLLIWRHFSYDVDWVRLDSIPALGDVVVRSAIATASGLDRAASFVLGFLSFEEPGPKARAGTSPVKIKAIGGLAKDHFEATVLLVAGVRHAAGFMVSYIAPGRSARKEFGGDLIPGPWASAFGRSAVIDDQGGTGAQLRQLEADGRLVRVSLGDVVDVEGLLMRIEAAPNNNIALVQI